jgi:hypothetical protein
MRDRRLGAENGTWRDARLRDLYFVTSYPEPAIATLAA